MNKEKITFTINDVPELKKDIEQMQKKYQQQINQLTNNWNELEEWVKEMSMGTCEYNSYDEVRDKMEEIKEKNDKD